MPAAVTLRYLLAQPPALLWSQADLQVALETLVKLVKTLEDPVNTELTGATQGESSRLSVTGTVGFSLPK